MRYIIFLIINLSFISKLILSQFICDLSYTGTVSTNTPTIDFNDVINIKFANIGNNVDGLNFVTGLIYSYNLLSTSQPQSSSSTSAPLSIEDYMKKNIKSIDFQLFYKENNIDKIINCRYDLQVNNQIQRVFEIINLNYLTDYKLNVGYTTQSGRVFRNKDSISFRTCFGGPNEPIDLKYTIGSDCVLKLSWKPPLIINAPNVCYYDLKIRDYINPQIVSTPATPSYMFTNVKPNSKYEFYIQSVNSNQCYNNNNSTQTCKTIIGNSAYLLVNTGFRCDIIIGSYNSSTSLAQSTTRKPFNNANENYLNIINLLFILILTIILSF